MKFGEIKKVSVIFASHVSSMKAHLGEQILLLDMDKFLDFPFTRRYRSQIDCTMAQKEKIRP